MCEKGRKFMVWREPARLGAIALAQAEALESARMALKILFAGSGEFGAPSLSADVRVKEKKGSSRVLVKRQDPCRCCRAWWGFR